MASSICISAEDCAHYLRSVIVMAFWAAAYARCIFRAKANVMEKGGDSAALSSSEDGSQS